MTRYEKLGSVELNVTDLERARKFYEEIVGLQYVGVGNAGELQFRCDNEHHSVSLYKSATAGLRCLGLMLEDDAQFATLQRSLESVNVPWKAVPEAACRARQLSRAVRVFEPNVGAVLEFYLPVRDARRPFVPSVTKIQRIGHVVFNTEDPARAIAFWRDVLNFRESDSVGEQITFMRCFPNPYHHGVGIGKFARKCLHHVNFMVSEIDDIGRALSRLRESNVPVVYGPGRHMPSGSIFLYYLDPDGLTLEYSFGMEEFDEDYPRAARALPLRRDVLDMWTSPFDPRTFALAGPNAASLEG